MSRQRRLLVVWAFVVFGLVVRAAATGLLRGDGRDELVLVAERIDVNRASAAELAVLSGIGRTRAQAIVLFRVRHGPFASLEALAAVDGCGPGTVEALRPHAFAGRPSSR